MAEDKLNIYDPHFEENVSRLLDDFSDDDEIGDPNFCLLSVHDTSSEEEYDSEGDEMVHSENIGQMHQNLPVEQSSSNGHANDYEKESEVPSSKANYYYGKNGFKWAAQEPTRCLKTPLHNIVRLPAVRKTNISVVLPSEFAYWSLIFDNDILNILIDCTNEKINQTRGKYSNPNRYDLKPIDKIEFKAFLGLLIYTAVFKSNHEDTTLLFAKDGTGRDIFRATMSQTRFLIILSCLRFDNIHTRSERLKTDKLAAISNIFNKVIENSQKYYSIGTHACVDEMLVPFRGRCSFKIYMPKKPARYGILIRALTDARTNYLTSAYIYHGKGCDGIGLTEQEKKFSVPTQSVLRLIKTIEGSNRNITADNWFSSIELVNKLKEKKLTYIGTIKKQKREIPPEFLPGKRRSAGTSLYGFTKDLTLLSYVPKKNRAVLLISTMHHRPEEDPVVKKPTIIVDYNNTKGGVDELDKKCSIYSSSRRTRRWPMAIFFSC